MIYRREETRRREMRKILGGFPPVILFLALVTFGAGCSEDEEIAPAGTLKINITETPPGYEITSVLVTFSAVEVHKAVADKNNLKIKAMTGKSRCRIKLMTVRESGF
jgi:hypothetical protein